MRIFILYTAVIEALTGIGLLVFPSPLVSFLFGSPLTGNDGLILARIAGAAILSLALLCYIQKEETGAPKIVKILVFYNLVVALIFLYGLLNHELSGIGTWMALVFHFFQTILGFVVLQKKQTYSIKKI